MRRVIFIEDLDLFPHALIKAGETGIVSESDEKSVTVQLTKYHDGLDYWENQVMLSLDKDDSEKPQFSSHCREET